MDRKTSYKYDVFISYRWVSPDQEWVREQLYPALENAGLKVCVDVEDFVLGRDLILEMERAGHESRHVLCVLSPEYFEEGRIAEFENLSAQRRDLAGRDSFLIPFILRETDVPDRIRGLIPADWTKADYHEREWKKLLRVLGARNLNAPPPSALGTTNKSVPYRRSRRRSLSTPHGKEAEECPYRGLEPFYPDHGRFFFGREALRESVLYKMRPGSNRSRNNRFLTIVGSSGSGKSSFALASLLPALQQGALDGTPLWPAIVFRPGYNPVESLAVALSSNGIISSDTASVSRFAAQMCESPRTLHLALRVALDNKPKSHRAIILIDQFEEFFTLCDNEGYRTAAFNNILHVNRNPDGQAIIIITMRSDFFDRCATYPELRAAVSQQTELVGPLTGDELQSAIEKPARLVGCEFDPGLVEILLQEVKGQVGALPLLQYALKELWKRREGNRLTIESYKQIGRIQGALESRADEVYGALPPEHQELCRRLFLRLTYVGEGSEIAKRRIPIGEVLPVGDQAAVALEIVQALVSERLLTTSGELTSNESTVEVAHEALLSGWSRLREWIDQDREATRFHNSLAVAAHEWLEAGRNESYLYRGSRLIQAGDWLQAHEGTINNLEHEFLAESFAQIAREVVSVEAGRIASYVKGFSARTPMLPAALATEAKKHPYASPEQLNARLAMHMLGLQQLSFLLDRLLQLSFHDLQIVCEVMQDRRVEVIGALRSILAGGGAPNADELFRLWFALARFDPPADGETTRLWKVNAAFIADQFLKLTITDPNLYPLLRMAFWPAREVLAEPLATDFKNERDPTRQSLATSIIAEYFADRPEILIELIKEATPSQYATLFPLIKKFQGVSIPLLAAEMSGDANDSTSSANKRIANSSIALLQLGIKDPFWPLLKHSKDPELRTYLIHRCSPLNVDSGVLVERFLSEGDTSISRALILTLSEYELEQLPVTMRADFIAKLVGQYESNPDSGLHGAARFLLKRWGLDDKIADIDAKLKKEAGHVAGREWFITPEGFTFSIVRNPPVFIMGAPEKERDYDPREKVHAVSIGRSFAISSTTVTVEQFKRFTEANPEVRHTYIPKYSPFEDGPQIAITWYEAAQYCRWLSEREEVPEDQMCYPPLAEIKEGMSCPAGYLTRGGYRLATEAEWEYACRSQTVTSRYYGQDDDMLGYFARFIYNSTDYAWPVGQLKPNDFGLFDMIGNVWEWCLDEYKPYPCDSGVPVEDKVEVGPVFSTQSRVVRGGAFYLPPRYSRSAYRYGVGPDDRHFNVSLRLARTVHHEPPR